MKLYKALITLDENRENCLDCPFCLPDDACVLQDLDPEDIYDWGSQLSRCPLIVEG